jgi:hypothetical protein
MALRARLIANAFWVRVPCMRIGEDFLPAGTVPSNYPLHYIRHCRRFDLLGGAMEKAEDTGLLPSMLEKIFLLSIFSKGERANLSQSERNELKQILGSLADVYKKGVKHYVQSRK